MISPARVPKILIIGCNAETREMTRSVLRGLPFEIEECGEGINALRSYKDIRPQWVLIDWEMKQMNGLSATRSIIREYPKAQIVMLTQYGDEELRKAALEAGAKGSVLKDDLIALRSFLEKH